MSTPSVLLIHGAWHNPNHYRKLVNLMNEHNIPTICPQLPSYDSNGTNGLLEDSAFIQQQLNTLINDGKTIIVMGHSYGGLVMTQSVTEEMGVQYRQKKGLKGGVHHLVYICAFMVSNGEQIIDALKVLGGPPPWISVDEEKGLMSPIMADAGQAFYSDVPQGEHQALLDELRPMTVGIHFTPLCNAAWEYYPATYLYCNQDGAIPVFVQRNMVEKCKKEGAKVEERECDAGHSPSLSQPETILRIVQDIIGSQH